MKNKSQFSTATSEHQKAAAALQNLLDSSSMMMFSIDQNYCYTAFNSSHAWAMKNNYNAEIQNGSSILDFINVPADREKAKLNFDRALNGESFDDLVQSEAQNARGIFLKFHYGPIVDAMDGMTGVNVISENITALKAAEAALSSSEELFRTTFYNASVGVVLVGLGGAMLQVNPAFCDLLGYSGTELTGTYFNAITFEEDKPIGSSFIKEALAGLTDSIHFEKRYIRKDGSLLWADVSSTVFRNAAGEFQYLITHIQDISLAKEAQAELLNNQTRLDDLVRERTRQLATSEALYRSLFENISSIIIIFDPQTGRLLDANPAACTFFEYTQADLIQLSMPELVQMTAEELPTHAANVRSGETKFLEATYRQPNGEIRNLGFYPGMIQYKQGPAVLAVVHDFTQAKQSEQILRDSESTLRSVIDRIPDFIWSALPDGNIDYLNEGWLAFTGLTQAQALGEGWMQALHPDDVAATGQRWSQATRECAFFEAEQRLRRFDGEYCWFLSRAQPVLDEQGRLVKWYGVNTDISARKKAEEQIAFQASMLEQVHNGVIVVDLSNKILYWNKFAEELYQWTSAEAVGKDIVELLSPEEMKEIVHGNFAKMQREGHWEGEFNVRRKDGSAMPVHITNSYLQDISGKNVGLIGISVDIADRKQAEEQLKLSEEKWRGLFEVLPVGVSIVDAENGLVDTNAALAQILDFSEESLLLGDYKNRKYLRPDRTPMPAEEFPSNQAFREQKIIRNVEIGIVKEDGAEIWTSVSATPLASGVGTATVTVNISERKQMEMNLSKRIKELTCLHEVSRLLENESISEAELCQKVLAFLLPAMKFPNSASAVLKLDKKYYQAGNPSDNLPNQLFAPILVDDQEYGQLSVYYPENANFQLPEEQDLLDNLAAMLGFWLDRKKSESQVRKLSRAVEQSPVSVVITDLKGTVEYVNPRFTALTGYTLEEAVGQNPRILKSGYTSRAEYTILWQTILSGQVWRGELRNRKKNGEFYWENASISPILDENGTVTHFIAVKEDVTERKQDQVRIAEALAFNQTILDASPMGITIYNAAGDCISANKAAALIIGSGDPKNLLSQNIHTIESWKKSGMYAAALQALSSSQPGSLRVNSLSSFGKDFWLNATFVVFKSGGEAHLMFMFEDDSERQKAEELLRLSNNKLEALVADLERSNRDADLLRQMSDMLQICNGVQEAYTVLEQFAPQIFSKTAGAVYMTNESMRAVDAVSTWGELASELVFEVEDCWALRRGRVHKLNSSLPGLKCQHVDPAFDGVYLDVPLVASGESLGLLHLEWSGMEAPGKGQQELAQIMAEHISLSLSNIRLREKLHEQSVRDPLTHAFNRRYMEESLARELPRAKRKNIQVGMIMLDIDHFKKFNDNYGHAAGDMILVRLAALLQTHVRGEDIVCRLGGEEFLMILPDANRAVTLGRAELIRVAVQAMDMEFNGKHLTQINVSQGVAIYPEHGSTGQEMMEHADFALYRAKENGRNRVEVFTPGSD